MGKRNRLEEDIGDVFDGITNFWAVQLAEGQTDPRYFMSQAIRSVRRDDHNY